MVRNPSCDSESHLAGFLICCLITESKRFTNYPLYNKDVNNIEEEFISELYQVYLRPFVSLFKA